MLRVELASACPAAFDTVNADQAMKARDRLHQTGTELLKLIMGMRPMTRLGLCVLCDNCFVLGLLIRCKVRFQGVAW